MKKSVLCLALFTSLSAVAYDGCPGAEVVARAGGHESSGGCPGPSTAIEVRFASDGTGADSKGREVLLQSVAEGMRNGALLKVLNKRWGREGESTLCLQFSSDSTQAQAYEEISKSVCDARDPSKMSPQFRSLGRCDDAEFGL